MSAIKKHAMTLVIAEPELSAFEVRRRDVAIRTTLELAGEMAKAAAEKAAKAASLMGTASALPERRDALRDGPDGYLAALRAAYGLLGDVLEEMG